MSNIPENQLKKALEKYGVPNKKHRLVPKSWNTWNWYEITLDLNCRKRKKRVPGKTAHTDPRSCLSPWVRRWNMPKHVIFIGYLKTEWSKDATTKIHHVLAFSPNCENSGFLLSSVGFSWFFPFFLSQVFPCFPMAPFFPTIEGAPPEFPTLHTRLRATNVIHGLTPGSKGFFLTNTGHFRSLKALKKKVECSKLYNWTTGFRAVYSVYHHF